MDRQELLAYIRKTIYGAVTSDRQGLIALLRDSGVIIGDNVDNKTLYAMVLTAMTKSNAFKNSLTELLYNKYNNFSGNNFGTQAYKRWNAIDNSSTQGALLDALKSGIDTLQQEIQAGGSSGVVNELNNPTVSPQQTVTQNKTVNYVPYVVAVIVVGVGIWYITKKKK